LGQIPNYLANQTTEMKTHKLLIVAVSSILLCAGHSVNVYAVDEPSDTKPREFMGYIETGTYLEVDKKLCTVPILTDPSRPPVIKLADDSLSDAIIRDICKPESISRGAPSVVREMNRTETFHGKSRADMLHIAIYTIKSVPMDDKKFKVPCRFQPGSLTKLDDVIKKHGKPTEQESYGVGELASSIGLHGIVSWWGSVGIAASVDDTITHIFVREREAPKNSK